MTLDYDGLTDVRYSSPWKRFGTIAYGAQPVLPRQHNQNLRRMLRTHLLGLTTHRSKRLGGSPIVFV